MKFRERSDREVDNGEEGQGGQAERKRQQQKKEREVWRLPWPHSLGWTPRQSVQVLRFSPIYIKAPGTQVQAPNRVKRSSDAEKERSAQLGLRKNEFRKHTHAKMGLWDLTKQHHGAISVLKLKYANLIKMNMRARSTLIEVFGVTSVNLWEMLCVRSLSA